MARCEWCDRDECKKVETWAAFVACNCAIDIARPCEHQTAAHEANVACELHRVNWRERALAAEAEIAKACETIAMRDQFNRALGLEVGDA